MLDFLYRHQAQITPAGTHQDVAGGETPATFLAGVPVLPCQLQQDSPYDRTNKQMGHRADGTVAVFFPKNPGVRVGDVLRVLTDGRVRRLSCTGPAVDRSGQTGAGGMLGAVAGWQVTATEAT